MKITIITVGKIKEKYLKDAIAEYSKRATSSFGCRKAAGPICGTTMKRRAAAGISRIMMC